MYSREKRGQSLFVRWALLDQKEEIWGIVILWERTRFYDVARNASYPESIPIPTYWRVENPDGALQFRRDAGRF